MKNDFVIDPKVTSKVEELLSKYPTVNHPLIKRMEHLDFTQEAFQKIAERFYHVIKNFPRFLAAAISNWDDTTGRMPLVENLFEEHGRMDVSKIHLHTYLDYLGQMGIDVDKVVSSKATPATISYVRSVLDICTHRPFKEGLAALGIIEDIVHRVSAVTSRFSQALNDIEHVSHFDDHKVLDDQHSKEIYSLIKIDSSQAEEQAMLGLTMGAFYHSRLYSNILDEVSTNNTVKYLNVDSPKNIKTDYPLEVGDSGAERLNILNQLYNLESLQHLEKAVGPETSSFLEIGCGTGEISALMAKQFPHLYVLGTDLSPQQIDLAANNWSSKNLTFKQASVADIKKNGEQFDVIYVRWVLIYQKELQGLLSDLVECLKPEGVLIIEDNDPQDSGAYCVSGNPVLEEWDSFWSRGVSLVGQRPGFEKRLITDLCQNGLTLVTKEISQQVLNTPEEKSVFFLGIKESAERILQSGFPEPALNQFLNKLWQLRDDDLPVVFVRNFILTFKKDGG